MHRTSLLSLSFVFAASRRTFRLRSITPLALRDH